VQLLDRAAATEDPCVATGRAGGLLALLNLHAAGHPGAGERAQRWAERLVPDASVPTRLGLFHGRLGVIWALARAARQLEHPALRRRADELLDAFPSERLAGLGVAEGLGGLAVVHAELDPESFTARRISQRLADAAGANRDDSLAEGWLGVADIALARDGGLLPRHARRVSRLADEITHDSRLLRCGTPGGLAVPGFLHGLAGIGHALLRLHDQTAVASALTLDGPSPAPEHAPTCVNSASCV
jgi:hypothetical protein